jgi:hypothetical protein
VRERHIHRDDRADGVRDMRCGISSCGIDGPQMHAVPERSNVVQRWCFEFQGRGRAEFMASSSCDLRPAARQRIHDGLGIRTL